MRHPSPLHESRLLVASRVFLKLPHNGILVETREASLAVDHLPIDDHRMDVAAPDPRKNQLHYSHVGTQVGTEGR